MHLNIYSPDLSVYINLGLFLFKSGWFNDMAEDIQLWDRSLKKINWFPRVNHRNVNAAHINISLAFLRYLAGADR